MLSTFKDLGMVVNETKTELITIGDCDEFRFEIEVNDARVSAIANMKALGILLGGNLNWDRRAEKAINKGNQLLSIFRYVLKHMTEKQFLKSVTSNYYSTVFYGASIWLPLIKSNYKKLLESLHFRLLWTACKDFHCQISRSDLTMRCKKATPKEWALYNTSSVAMKIIRDAQPCRLHNVIKANYYSEHRNAAKGMFFDSSKSKKGQQSFQNRLKHVSFIKEPWNELGTRLSNHKLRTMLKRTFFTSQSELVLVK